MPIKEGDMMVSPTLKKLNLCVKKFKKIDAEIAINGAGM